MFPPKILLYVPRLIFIKSCRAIVADIFEKQRNVQKKNTFFFVINIILFRNNFIWIQKKIFFTLVAFIITLFLRQVLDWSFRLISIVD